MHWLACSLSSQSRSGIDNPCSGKRSIYGSDICRREGKSMAIELNGGNITEVLLNTGWVRGRSPLAPRYGEGSA